MIQKLPIGLFYYALSFYSITQEPNVGGTPMAKNINSNHTLGDCVCQWTWWALCSPPGGPGLQLFSGSRGFRGWGDSTMLQVLGIHVNFHSMFIVLVDSGYFPLPSI
jgi:hypothetical protein